jgi:hypothetical protein
MKILLKTQVREHVVTVFQASTSMILDNSELPENTTTNVEVGALVNALIGGEEWAVEIVQSNKIIEQSIEMGWIRQALDQRKDERGIRNCLRGIRINDLRTFA